LRGGGELRVIAQERVQAGQHVQPVLDRVQHYGAPRGGKLAAGGCCAEQQRGRPKRECLVDRRHDRGAVARQPLRDVAACLRRVDHGRDLVRTVADDAHRGLRGDLAELAFGQDRQPVADRAGRAPCRCSLHSCLRHRYAS
jgi:hypothetical protein